MPIRKLSALLFALFFLFSSRAALAQNSGVNGKTPPSNQKTDLPAQKPAPENWTDLRDITTGLQPFLPQLVETDERPGFVRQLVRLQWRIEDPIDVWIIRPKTTDKVPAVLYLYSYPDDPDQFRDDGWDTRATSGGFAAVGFVSALTGQRYHMRPMKQWFVSELVESLGSSVHDVQLVLNHLAARGDIDMDHIGIFGMGSGGSIAILAAHTDSRIKAVDVLDPWADWPDWLRESPIIPEPERANYLTTKFLASVAPVDPIAALPSLAAPSVRVQQTLTDQATPNRAKERIAASLRDQEQLIKYATPQDHLKAYQSDGLSGWIKRQLRAPESKGSQASAPAASQSQLSSTLKPTLQHILCASVRNPLV